MRCFFAALVSFAGAAWADCVLVFGHGRNASDDTEANALWDGVNLAFNEGVALTLKAAGHSAVPLVLKVTATDLARNAELLMAQAREAGCGQLVETTVFADTAAGLLIARLRVHPLVRGTGSEPDRIGEPIWTDRRDFELSQATLDRVQPGVLGQRMAEDYLRASQPGR